MRLPFIQVDMDFLATSAGDLSELLRTSEAEAGWSMVRLWGWALTKAATPEVLGLLVGADMQRLAERAAGWQGEPGAFLEALCNPAVALAERETEHRIRLVGMERYATTYRKMEADRARKSKRTPAEVARNSSGIPSEVAGKTQTQTQTQIEATALQEPTPSDSVADDIPHAAEEDAQEADTRPALVLSPPVEKPEALQAAWNQHAHPSLPRWQGLSEKRRRSAAARLRERPLDAWVQVIQRLSASPFCRGEDKGSSWRASPDWLLQPDVADKVLEGKYDRHAAPERHLGIAPPPGAPTAEDRRRAHQEYLAREAAKKAGGAS